jgi:hypothetical protein
VNAHDLGAAAQPQGGKQSGNAEDMVEMAVREQDPVKPPKARPAAEQLTLYPFAAIDENTMPACPNEKARMIAVCRRNARRGSQECEFEHRQADFGRSVTADFVHGALPARFASLTLSTPSRSERPPGLAEAWTSDVAFGPADFNAGL